MRETVEQRCCHLGIDEDGWPFAEGEIGRDDDGRALVEATDEMEQQLGRRPARRADSRTRRE
jgi:hypothetical protein